MFDRCYLANSLLHYLMILCVREYVMQTYLLANLRVSARCLCPFHYRVHG